MARRGDGIYLRGRTWWLDFVHKGERHVARLGKGISRTVAGELARVRRGEVLKGEAGIGRKRKDITFDAARDEFKKWAEANKRPRTVRTYGQCLDALARSFAGRRLSAISTFDVERHKRARLEAGVRVMVNRELAVLRALYNRCRDWGKYEGDNPVVKVRQVKESAGRLRYLEGEEIDALVAAAGEPLRTLLLVGLYTGIRIHSEALTLRWADVDLRRGLLTVQSAYAKSGKTRTVPLNRPVVAALRAIRERSGDREHVFARRDGSAFKSIRTAFLTACRRAGLAGVTPHVLRHTFASRLAMTGAHPRTIQELGGWSELAMVERYAHLSASHKAEAVERIATSENSPTLFTTPAGARIIGVRNRAERMDAPVAQVDRAAVS
jgi:integrase